MNYKNKLAVCVVAILICTSVGMTGVFFDAARCEMRDNTVVTNKGTNDIIYVLIVTTNETRDSWLYVMPNVYNHYSINESYNEMICKNRYVINAKVLADALNFEETLPT